MSENDDVLDRMFVDQGGSAVANLEMIVIVDRSGSMGSIQKDAQGGLNSFLDEQRKLEGNATVTLVEFDSVVDVLFESKDIAEVEPYVLRPRGTTALLDAIGMGVSQHNAKDDKSVMVVIVTDGGENASREYTNEGITKLIAEKEEAGWDFLFLAANQDAIKAGASIGISADRSFNFAATGDGVGEAYTTASVYASSMRTKGKDAAFGDLLSRKADLGQD